MKGTLHEQHRLYRRRRRHRPRHTVVLRLALKQQQNTYDAGSVVTDNARLLLPG